MRHCIINYVTIEDIHRKRGDCNRFECDELKIDKENNLIIIKISGTELRYKFTDLVYFDVSVLIC